MSTKLPEIVDDGMNNNYGEWEIRSYHQLREWDLLKYIEGPTSQPPIIPPLRQPATYHGVDDHGHPSTVHDRGNVAEHEQALRDAIPWMTGNNTALDRIICAVPRHWLYLLKDAKYAKEAWENLHAVYQPLNSLRAATRKAQIMRYRCEPDMNIAMWLTDMQRLYTSLCSIDAGSMSDREFALTILVLMPLGRDEGWKNFLSGLRMEVRNSDEKGLPIHSTTFIMAIRDYWNRHKDDHRTTTSDILPAAGSEAQRGISKRKRARTDVASAPGSDKHARTQQADRENRQCANPSCSSPRGHDTSECFSYQGAKEGLYGYWWRGPWNLHLPPSLRTKENNFPPKGHPVFHVSRKKERARSKRKALRALGRSS